MSAMKGGCWAAYVISWRATRDMDLSPLLPCDKPNGHARDIAHDHLGIGPEEDPGRLAVGVRYPVVDIAVIDNPQVESVGPLQEVLDLRVLAHKAPAGHGVAAVGQGELRAGRPLYRHPGVYAGIDCFLAHLEYEDSHLPTSLRSVSHSQLSGERLSLAVRRRVKFSRAIWRPIRRATRRTAASIRCSASAVSAQSPLVLQASGRSWSSIIADPFPGDSGKSQT